MKEMMLHHKGSFIFSIVTMILGFGYGLYLFGNVPQAMGVVFIMAVLSVLEISLSFDNAIVNAKVLGTMDEKWQRIFLTWGMLIAVGFMRLVFPILIVSIAGGIGIFDALSLAVDDHTKYSELLQTSHITIAGFGGAFLALVALDFFFDAEKDVHWIGVIERTLSKLGERKSISIVITILAMVFMMSFLTPTDAQSFFMAGIWGIVTHELVKLVGDLMESGKEGGEDTDLNLTQAVAKNGLAGFLYLEVLDASFSADSVLAALVISKDIFVIAGGLAIGAMAVRSLTVQMVKSGTLSEYKYLEHSAFYAILTLACIMFASTIVHIPEVLTAALSVAFIGAGWYHSTKVKD